MALNFFKKFFASRFAFASQNGEAKFSFAELNVKRLLHKIGRFDFVKATKVQRGQYTMLKGQSQYRSEAFTKLNLASPNAKPVGFAGAELPMGSIHWRAPTPFITLAIFTSAILIFSSGEGSKRPFSFAEGIAKHVGGANVKDATSLTPESLFPIGHVACRLYKLWVFSSRYLFLEETLMLPYLQDR